MIEYKGYVAEPVLDGTSGTYSGVVLNISDTVHFEGDTPAEVEAAFRGSIDEYLLMCREEGIEPNPPGKGELRIHLDESVYGQLLNAAREAGENVDTFVGRYLAGSFGAGRSPR